MPTWGDHKASGRRHARRRGRSGRRRTDRGRHRKGGCRWHGLLVALVVSLALWAALLVPLILWGPL